MPSVDNGLLRGEDGVPRCAWAGSAPEYLAYHDQEWGQELHGDDALFERLTLEGFQAGLAWITILRKRPAFREVFRGFVIEVVAGFTAADVTRLLAEARIVRNRAKIEAAVTNARCALTLPDGLSAHLWSFAPEASPPRPPSLAQVRTTSPESVAMAADLRGRGFRFVGPTTAHALLQAVGMVDEHLAGCAATT